MGILFSKADKDINLSFSMADANPDTYRTFIQALRSRLLTDNPPLSHGIPVLSAREDVPDKRRFLLVDLTDIQGKTITVAIDVVNAYVVGYAANGTAYFLAAKRQYRELLKILFPEISLSSSRLDLGFKGIYRGLSRAAAALSGAQPREGDAPPAPNYLGLSQLDNAIRNLFFAGNESLQARGFTVIIQMLSEAVRFPMIEEEISNRMVWGNTTPYARGDIAGGSTLESLERNWSSLSQEIQRFPPNQIEFSRQIELQPDPTNNLNDFFERYRGIALLLNYGNPQGPSHLRVEL